MHPIKSTYQCQACGYQAACAVDPESGSILREQVYHCEGCRSLIHDPPSAASSSNPSGDQKLIRCGDCGSPRIHIWHVSHPCPRCGDHMLKMQEQQLV